MNEKHEKMQALALIDRLQPSGTLMVAFILTMYHERGKVKKIKLPLYKRTYVRYTVDYPQNIWSD